MQADQPVSVLSIPLSAGSITFNSMSTQHHPDVICRTLLTVLCYIASGMCRQLHSLIYSNRAAASLQQRKTPRLPADGMSRQGLLLHECPEHFDAGTDISCCRLLTPGLICALQEANILS